MPCGLGDVRDELVREFRKLLRFHFLDERPEGDRAVAVFRESCRKDTITLHEVADAHAGEDFIEPGEERTRADLV